VLSWNKGQQRAIVGLISRITHKAVLLNLLCGEELDQSREIRSTWNRSQSESSGPTTSSESSNIEWFITLEQRVKQIFAREENTKDTMDVTEAFRIARSELQKSIEQQLPTISVRDVAPEDLWDIFGLRREIGPSHHWFLTPIEVRVMSNHLGKSYLQP
jgi:hypothetical protein